ncbi:MAG: DUF3783 domain-containing protein [Deltaproteobacteria bacterium]|nr:DUF3783 domain-containing protein [Deltaproteobacteria bacterium]
MSDQGTFERIEDSSEQRMFGPRAVLVCGLTAEEQETMAALLASFDDLPLSVAGPDDLDRPVGDLLSRPSGTGVGQDSTLARAIILSGLMHRELHEIMQAYKKTALSRPLWAALTPTSKAWPLKDLLAELNAERTALDKR